MNTTAGPAVPASRPPTATEAGPRPAAFRVRLGRTALALLGALAVAGVVIGGTLALLGVVPVAVPGWALLTAAADVLALRALAVRDRKRRSLARMEAAFRDAMNPFSPASAEPPRRSNAPVFNAQDTAAQDTDGADTAAGKTGSPAAEPAPLSVNQLREAARAVAAELGDAPRPTWDPVAVPKPTYVGAAKARQPEPAPLAAPEVKKPTVKTSIKASVAAPRTAAPHAAVLSAAVSSAAVPNAAVPNAVASSAAAPKAAGADTAGRINLDAVLQRRRA